MWRGTHFAVVGRLQVRWAAGTWNEWYCVFDDGRVGWLGDAAGEYTVSFETTVPEPLLWSLTNVTLGRTACPTRAGTDLGRRVATAALAAWWQAGESGDTAWRGGQVDPVWRERTRTTALTDFQLTVSGCWERVAPLDGTRTWHEYRVTVQEDGRAALSKVVVVHTAANARDWKITGIEGPLP